MIVGPRRASSLSAGMRPVANRTSVPSAFGSAVPFMVRKAHYATPGWDGGIVIKWGNFAGITEASNGGIITITASIEYPLNTFTQLKFSGSTSGTIGAGAILAADASPIFIPPFAQCWSRFFWQSTVGIPFNGTMPYAPNLGDAMTTNGTDQTMGGTVVDNSGTNQCWPLSIEGLSTQTSLGFAGDSITVGAQPFADDTSGFTGSMAPSFGPQFPYTNCGVPGETAQNFLLHSSLRVALLANCDRIVVAFGINDVAAGRTAAQVYADLISIKALFAGKKVYILTVTPRSTSTNFWSSPTGADQTAVANSSVIDALNVLILANSAGFDGVYDVSPVARLGSNPDLWNAAGPANWPTGDGLHPAAIINNRFNWVMPP
jgi:lysophospholipase L1-like esterase